MNTQSNKKDHIQRLIHEISPFTRIVVREFIDDRLFLRAMALTFATLLSLIPLLAISFTMFKLFGGGEWFMEMLRPVLMNNLAPGAEPVVAERIQNVIGTFGGTTVGGIGLLFLVLAVYGIFTAIESTFNLIWGVSSRAGALRRLPLYWGMVTIIPILVVSSLAITTYIKALPLVSEMVQRVNFFAALTSRMLPVALVMVSLFLLYRFLPSTRVKAYAAITGAVIAGLLYEIVKFFFILYIGKLVRYDVLYGSLAIIPLLMVWVNLSWVVVLAGVEICFVTQHYTVLQDKRKHVQLSRTQMDVLGYMILSEVTQSFRGNRQAVTIEEWTQQYGFPPSIVREIVDRLSIDGILQQTGSGDGEILLKKDPNLIKISEVTGVLWGETQEEWNLPVEERWSSLESWYKASRKYIFAENRDITLAELVGRMENGAKDLTS